MFQKCIFLTILVGIHFWVVGHKKQARSGLESKPDRPCQWSYQFASFAPSSSSHEDWRSFHKWHDWEVHEDRARVARAWHQIFWPGEGRKMESYSETYSRNWKAWSISCLPKAWLRHFYLPELVIYIIIVHRKWEFWVPGRKSMNLWKIWKILLTSDRISMKIWKNLLEPHIPDLHTFSISFLELARFCILFQSPYQNWRNFRILF